MATVLISASTREDSELGFSNRGREQSDHAIYRTSCTSGRNWSLAQLHDTQHPGAHAEFLDALGRELSDLGVTHALAPSVNAMSGRTIDSALLTESITLPYGVTIFRNRAQPADAVSLKPGETFIMSGGGCPIAVITGPDLCIVAHVSRDSAIDRGYVETGMAMRTHLSVIDAMSEELVPEGCRPEALVCRQFFALPAEAFGHPHDHPEHGRYNRRVGPVLARLYGAGATYREGASTFIDMSVLIEQQARRRGFSFDYVAGKALPFDGPFGHTRHPDPSMQLTRNLVIVHRSS